jgi:hypothetical protein
VSGGIGEPPRFVTFRNRLPKGGAGTFVCVGVERSETRAVAEAEGPKVKKHRQPRYAPSFALSGIKFYFNSNLTKYSLPPALYQINIVIIILEIYSM